MSGPPISGFVYPTGLPPAPPLPDRLVSFKSIADLIPLKRFTAYILCENGRFLIGDANGQVRGDLWDKKLWEVYFLDETRVVLKNTINNKIMTAEKILGFAGDVTAQCSEASAKDFEQWEILYAGRDGRFFLRSRHGYYLSIREGAVKAKVSKIEPSNENDATFRFVLDTTLQ